MTLHHPTGLPVRILAWGDMSPNRVDKGGGADCHVIHDKIKRVLLPGVSKKFVRKNPKKSVFHKKLLSWHGSIVFGKSKRPRDP